MSRKPDDLRRLAALRPVLEKRRDLLDAIRRFFRERDFLEVQTPVRIPAPALEDYIEAEPAGSQFLRTSPELHMKRLLAAGHERIYQIGPCFRGAETGRVHLPEFTMLEWYRAQADDQDILNDTMELLQVVALAVNRVTACRFGDIYLDLAAAPRIMTVDQAFAVFAHRDPGVLARQGDFERVLVDMVEPALSAEPRPVILRNYPIEMAGLARACPDNPTRAARWELYLGGLEIANAYSELCDSQEQERRFQACAELRQTQGRSVYPMDNRFLDALRSGLPPCGGIALGLDRLLMVLLGKHSIDDVTAFPPAWI